MMHLMHNLSPPNDTMRSFAIITENGLSSPYRTQKIIKTRGILSISLLLIKPPQKLLTTKHTVEIYVVKY